MNDSSEQQHTESIEERWKRVQSAAKNYNTSQQNVMSQEQGDPGGKDGEEDQQSWQPANLFWQESNTDSSPSGLGKPEGWDAMGHLEANYPTGHDRILNEEEQDEAYAMRLNAMDRSGMDMDYERALEASAPSSRGVVGGRPTETLTLWQTFVALYKRNTMIKYYLIGLLILLAATGAIIGVSISNKNSSSNKDCASASYSEDPSLLLPQESLSVSAGGFGSSLSASPGYLIVGAPNPACITNGGASCDDFTVGGGAYLYKRNTNNNNVWSLYSAFVLDDRKTAGDEFGASVAISEDSRTIAVGAPKDDELGVLAGAVYVIEAPFASTAPPIRLVSTDVAPKDEFGGSVSVSATTISGADGSSVRVTNVVAGSAFDDDFGSKSGGVYVFSKFDATPSSNACGGGDREIKAGEYVQCQKLLPYDGEANDHYGGMVDVAGRTVVVGAMWDDDRGIDSGAVYVYSLSNDGSWGLQQKLLPTNFESQANRFGVSVAASSSGRIVIGADLDDSQGQDSGAAYIYRLSNGVWNLESKLVDQTSASELSGFECGSSVDMSADGKVVVVGCPGAPGGGVAYIYELGENRKWVQMDRFTVPSGYSGINMGGSVALGGGEDGMAVVGYGKSNGEVFSYRKDC